MYHPHTDTPRPLPSSWEPFWASFALSMEAEGSKPRTLISYRDSASMFGRWLAERGEIPALAAITRQDVEAFLVHVGTTRKPATANMRFRGLKRLFGWLADEEEIAESPLAKVKPPRFKLDPPKVMTEAEVSRLLKACSGRDFDDRRDTAIIRFLIDTGCRRGEVEGLTLADVDPYKAREAVVNGKSGMRTVRIGNKTAYALDRYLRLRGLHKAAREPWLWLGKQGRLTGDGIFQMIERRAAQAGLEGKVFVHLFRHTFSHLWLSNGGSEGDLMRLNGWQSRVMVDRYGASAAGERARASHAEFSPGDRIK